MQTLNPSQNGNQIQNKRSGVNMVCYIVLAKTNIPPKIGRRGTFKIAAKAFWDALTLTTSPYGQEGGLRYSVIQRVLFTD